MKNFIMLPAIGLIVGLVVPYILLNTVSGARIQLPQFNIGVLRFTRIAVVGGVGALCALLGWAIGWMIEELAAR